MLDDHNDSKTGNSGKGPDESGAELRGRVQEVIEARGLTKPKAAKEFGVSKATLGQWLAGNYKGSSKRLNARAEAWLKRQSSRDDLFVFTPTAQSIMDALSFTQEQRTIAVISGGPGVGKTSAIRRHHTQQSERVWVVTITPACSALVSCLEAVCDAIGAGEAGGGARRLSKAIQRRAAGVYRPLLIIDEAQHLTAGAIEELRAIHDATELGLAFVGNETTYARMSGGGRTAQFFAQFSSRVMCRRAYAHPTATDVEVICAALGIKDKEVIALLCRVAARPGGLRVMFKALAVLSTAGTKITVESLRKALKFLGAEA